MENKAVQLFNDEALTSSVEVCTNKELQLSEHMDFDTYMVLKENLFDKALVVRDAVPWLVRTSTMGSVVLGRNMPRSWTTRTTRWPS